MNFHRLQSQLAIEHALQFTEEDRFLDEVGVNNIYYGIENGELDRVAEGVTAALESVDRVSNYLTSFRESKFVSKSVYGALRSNLTRELIDLSLQTSVLATEHDLEEGDNFRSLALEGISDVIRKIFEGIRKAFTWIWGLLKKLFGFDGERQNKHNANSVEAAQQRLYEAIKDMNVFDEAKMNEFIADTRIPSVMKVRQSFNVFTRTMREEDIKNFIEAVCAAMNTPIACCQILYDHESALGNFYAKRIRHRNKNDLQAFNEELNKPIPLLENPAICDLLNIHSANATLITNRLQSDVIKELDSVGRQEWTEMFDVSRLKGCVVRDTVFAVCYSKDDKTSLEMRDTLNRTMPKFYTKDIKKEGVPDHCPYVIHPPIPTQLEILKGGMRKLEILSDELKKQASDLEKASNELIVQMRLLEQSSEDGIDYNRSIALFSHLATVLLCGSTSIAKVETIRSTLFTDIKNYTVFAAEAYEYAVKV